VTTEQEIRAQLDAQGWECVYAACRMGIKIEADDKLARACDNHGIVHLECAQIGEAPRLGADSRG
jgi:hypothetical protein